MSKQYFDIFPYNFDFAPVYESCLLVKTTGVEKLRYMFALEDDPTFDGRKLCIRFDIREATPSRPACDCMKP